MNAQVKNLFLSVLSVITLSACLIGCDTSYDATEATYYTPPLPEYETDTDAEIATSPTEESTESPAEAPTQSSHTHTWESATCTRPTTCSTCGETKGDASGHAWRDATCTDAKRCMECDTTEGSAKGHSWTEATCTSPKHCSSCGTSEGSALGHSYSGGKCTRCGTADPNYVADTMVWIPTKGGTKYHRNEDCSNMNGPIQVTKSEAISQGFDACKRCY